MSVAPPKLSPMSWAALVLGGAALVVVAMQSSKVVRAALMPSAGVGDVQKAVEEQAQRYAAAFEPHMAQINGRQLFLMPAPAPEADLEPVDEEPVETEPRVPTVYAGPSVVAMINDAVWFSNGTRIAKGEKDGDLKVLEIDAPWSAQVEWRGSEFTVRLFDRDALVLPVADRPDARRTPVVAAPALAPAPERPRPPEPKAADAGAAPVAAPQGAAPSPAPSEPAPGEAPPPEPGPSDPSPTDPAPSDEGPAKPAPSDPEPAEGPQPEARAPTPSSPDQVPSK